MDFEEVPYQWLPWIRRCRILGRSWLARMDLEGGNNSSYPSSFHAWVQHGPFFRRWSIPCTDLRWRRRGGKWWSDQLLEWRWWRLVLQWGGKRLLQWGWGSVWHNQSYAHIEASGRRGLVRRVKGFVWKEGRGEEWQALKKKEDKIHRACCGAI